MLFANVYNALEAFSNADAETIGTIINTFWPANENQTVQWFAVGDTNVTWNPQQMYNETYIDNFDPHQFAVLVFAVFGKIFLSYDLHPPNDYENLLEELADSTQPNDNTTYQHLFLILIDRFLVSAIYYLVACVCPFCNPSDQQGSFLIIGAVILLIQRWPRDWYGWIGIYVRLFFGAGLIATVAIWTSLDVGGAYLNSGTMMPTFVIVLVLIGAIRDEFSTDVSFVGLHCEFEDVETVSEGW
jgi:hypothetical protein